MLENTLHFSLPRPILSSIFSLSRSSPFPPQELLVVLDNFERAATAIKPESEREEKINSSYQVTD